MDDTFTTTVGNIYKKLNDGLCWDKIDKTIYDEIEKKREQNASVSDFAKLVFKIKNNDTLSYISSNIGRIDREKSTIYVICHNPHPSRHARDCHDKAFLKDDDIKFVPFLNEYVIETHPRGGSAKFWDC